MNDELNVPSQRSDQQVRNDRDDEYTTDDKTGGTHREPYGRNDEDVLVVSDRHTTNDTGPHPAPGDPDPLQDSTAHADPLQDSTAHADPLHDGTADTDPLHDAARDPDPDSPYDGPHDTVTATEQVTAAGPGPAQPAEDPPSHAAPQAFPLFEQDPDEVQSRWRDVQASFVDDPAEAVHRADGLVGEVVDSLTNALRSRTGELRERWKADGGDDTERLRQALREYRGVLEGLLAISGRDNPASSSKTTV
ncbi:hypothetical protein [Nonomuraea ferruginea]|uniref:Type VII secretion system (Wss) protein ESAT-6 n=1 Tax=Nonomuraea ferruginea TaxID=46174 RepID=A0ABT4T873_9ACTN|nr:hypothetical protein [Nonomuraea ferruginea]MDA0645717.1 hypothetical protein [Nonomuraea ferruginea]